MQHRLSYINTFTKMAHCQICGHTQVRFVKIDKLERRWKCLNSLHIKWNRQSKRRYIKNPQQANQERNLRRSPYRAVVGEVCELCGFVPKHPCQLDIHHKDHNHDNNDLSNLMTVCANCHRLDRVGLFFTGISIP